MNDAFKKEDCPVYMLSELQENPSYAATFFNFLTNLEKLIGYENKDVFKESKDREDYPDYSEWDKFAMYEYKRLSEEDDEEANDMLETNILEDGRREI